MPRKSKVNRGSAVSRKNAADWQRSGYEQWRKGDAAREKAAGQTRSPKNKRD
jgi:hypothetical protein